MFASLDEYYEYLESDTTTVFDYQISYRLMALRDKLIDNELKTHCNYEIYFWDFKIREGEVKPQLPRANGDHYPDFKMFDDDLKYIKARALSIRNPKYKSRYNHLLWESKHKHIDFAKQAVDNYFQFINSISYPINDNLASEGFGNLFKNLFILGQTINYKKSEAIQFLISLLGANRISGYQEYLLQKFISEKGKKIDASTLELFYNYSKKVVESSVYPDIIKEYLQLLIGLSQRLSHSAKPFHDQLAEFFLQQAEKKKGSFVAHHFYSKALEEYKKAGSKGKMEEVSSLVEKSKRNMGLKAVEFEHESEELKQYWNVINSMIDELIEKGTSEEIYRHIICSNRIFPKADQLGKDIRPAAFDFVHVTNFDINKNISGKQKSGLNQYNIHIDNFSIPHLSRVFFKGIKSGKLSFNSLLEFLKKNSWYGQNFTYLTDDGKASGFDWIELITPSLFSFFEQSEVDIKRELTNAQGYILCIDSLALKFEGLLREFSRSIGAQTIEVKENSTEERISFEKLLENEKFKTIVNPDTIALLKYLFTSEGLNLRNNIAHSFYKTKNYSPAIMVLMIAGLLRFGNYTVPKAA